MDLRGQPFFFERRGGGAPLLLIGGTGGDLRRPETRFDGPLPRRFDVLAWDQRGMGQSWKGDGPFTMADYADDAAALMDSQGWESADVLGISFGGMVAQEPVLRHPAKVRRLILCCTAAGGAGGASFPFHELPEMSADRLADLRVKIADTRHDEAWAAANPGPYRMLQALAMADPYRGEPGHVDGARRQIAARATHDSWARLPQIGCPVLVMGGNYDGIARPAVVTALANRIPGAQCRFFEGGHLFMLEDPAAYAAMVEFLSARAA
ncbi:MAG TPA: alpha/beta fold hydrolase [Rhizomicrobium sp.]